MGLSERCRRLLASGLLVTWRERAIPGEMRAASQEAVVGGVWPLVFASLLCAMAPPALGGSEGTPPSKGNWLIGQWAREPDACRKPEFTFRAESAMIFLEADGEPSVFVYPAVSYEINGPNITVSLGKRHPMAKTLGKTELQFNLKQNDMAFLQLLKGKVTPYQRCLSAESN